MLLFVYDAEPEVDLVGLIEGCVHAHDLTESLLGVLKASVPIVEYADTVPEFWLLRILEVVESLLIGTVSFLEIIHHEVAMTKGTPGLTIVLVKI